jgi:hypothetical protein
MRRSSMTRAFTLVELLVVISTTMVLLALLMPAIDMAMDAALRVRCAGNLHGWGAGVAQYYFDNSRKLPLPPKHMGPNNGQPIALPPNPRFRTNIAGEAGQITLDNIGPYIGHSRSPEGRVEQLNGLWYCPASKEGFFEGKWHDQTARTETGSGIMGGVLIEFIFSDYGYFGRGAESYRMFATQPDKLVGRDLQGGRILMGDTLYRWQNNGAWWFNHSTVGHSMHQGAGWREPTYIGEPPLTGINQLYGDGAVIWKDGSEFNPKAMEQKAYTERWVAAGAGTVEGRRPQTVSTNFY